MFNSDVSILSLVHACGSYPVNMIFDLIFGVLTPLSAICQVYHGDQF